MTEIPAVQTACTFVRERLTALLDEELTPEDTVLVRAHLADCSECQNERAALARMGRQLSEWRVPTIDITKQVLKAVGELAPYPGILPADMEQARQVQRETGEPLVSALVRLGLAPIGDAARAVADAAKLPFINLQKHKPEPDAIALLSPGLAWTHGVLPVRKDGHTLFIAAANPRDMHALDAVRTATGCMVSPLLTTLPDLQQALTDAYGPEPSAIARLRPATVEAPAQPIETAPASDAVLAAILDELRGLRTELGDARKEIVALRGEVRELRRQATPPVAPRRTEGTRLLPYAAPNEFPVYPGGHSFS